MEKQILSPIREVNSKADDQGRRSRGVYVEVAGMKKTYPPKKHKEGKASGGGDGLAARS